VTPLRLNQIAVVGGNESFRPVLAPLLRQIGGCLRIVAREREPLEEKKIRVHTRGAVEAIERVATFFVDRDGADVGLRQDLSFHSRDNVVSPRIRTAFACSCVEETDVIIAQRSRNFRAHIQWHLFPGVWIDADLPAEEELSAVLSSKMEEAAVFQKERLFLRELTLKRWDVHA
jgi:hypothetical protein